VADNIETKLDEILSTLNRLQPLVPRLSVEEDESRMRLLRVAEIAFVVTQREDQGVTEASESPPSASPAPDPKGATDDSLVIYSTDGKKYRSFASLSSVKTRYAEVPWILMTHRSYVVNLEAVTGIQTVPGGRLLSFSSLERKAKVTDDMVEPVENYLLGK
jgi:hypothetical protein